MPLTSDHPLLQPASWQPVSPRIIYEELKNKSRPPGRGHMMRTGSGLSPASAYVYLKARFGPANGFMMALRRESSDNIIHWHYTLSAGDSRLDFMGVASRLEIHARTTAPLDQSDLPLIAAAIQSDMARVGPAMSSIRRTLEPWRVFVNPYRRVRDIVDDAARRLESLAPDLRRFTEPLKSDQSQRQEQFTSLIRRQQEAVSLATTLRMLCPVAGEALVNLLIFLLANSHVRTDARLYETTIRADIDVRIKSLPLTCHGFAQAPSDSAPALRSFLSLMQHRNFILHGNVDPRKLEIEEVLFDPPHIPLFGVEQDFFERVYSLRMAHVMPDVALEDYSTLKNFTQYLLSCLRTEHASGVEMFLRDPFPGVRSDNGMAGVLFSETAVDLWLGEEDQPTGEGPGA